jgi:hypothetical protein
MKGNTIQQLLAERVEAFAVGDKPTQIIDTAVEKLFKDLVDEAFRSYGDFGKAVKDAVRAAMPANVSDMFELTRYNTLIVNSLRQRWEASSVGDDFLRRAHAAMDEALSDSAIPSRVRLSELLDAFVEEHREEATENGWERPHVIIKEDERGSTWRYITVAFDPQPEDDFQRSRSVYSSTRTARHHFQLKNCLSVHIQGETEDGAPFGNVYHAKLEGDPVGRDFSIRKRWERLVAALYFGVAELIVDCDEYHASYPGYD